MSRSVKAGSKVRICSARARADSETFDTGFTDGDGEGIGEGAAVVCPSAGVASSTLTDAAAAVTNLLRDVKTSPPKFNLPLLPLGILVPESSIVELNDY
ncbi:MAG TPA: hypothetical protein VMS32_07045 [Verrucomicrobiae bacterium]|nr:hypothetical protein [Verrucomicrobiae bacterium]